MLYWAFVSLVFLTEYIIIYRYQVLWLYHWKHHQVQQNFLLPIPPTIYVFTHMKLLVAMLVKYWCGKGLLLNWNQCFKIRLIIVLSLAMQMQISIRLIIHGAYWRTQNDQLPCRFFHFLLTGCDSFLEVEQENKGNLFFRFGDVCALVGLLLHLEFQKKSVGTQIYQATTLTYIVQSINNIQFYHTIEASESARMWTCIGCISICSRLLMQCCRDDGWSSYCPEFSSYVGRCYVAAMGNGPWMAVGGVFSMGSRV